VRLAVWAGFALALGLGRQLSSPVAQGGSSVTSLRESPAGPVRPAPLTPALRRPAAREAGLTALTAERRVPLLEALRGAPRRAPRIRAVDLARRAGILTPTGRGFEVAGVGHQTYGLTKHGLPVFNRRVKRHTGAVAGASGDLRLPPTAPRWAGISREAALERAADAIGLRIARAPPAAERGWFALDDRSVAAWRVVIPAREPFGSWQVIVDAGAGEVITALNLVREAQGVGSVYQPNAAQAGGVPSEVVLFDLDGSGYLAGRVVRIADRREVGAFRPDLQFVFPTSDPRFVQTSVYRALTDTARLAESWGFPALAVPLHAFVNLGGEGADGEYNNAFYDPFLSYFGFGNGDGVVLGNLGTDSDVAAHEMGHHLFETLAEPTVVFSSDPALAMHEGVADATAALWNGDPNIGESLRPGQPYLRTLDNARALPDDLAPDPHTTGLIYGGLLWDLAESIGAETAGRIMMAGFPFLPSIPDPHEFAQALASGDQAVTGGANALWLASAAEARGLVDPFPPEYQGEIGEDEPQERDLADGEFHYWLFYEFPNSRSVTFRTTGTGDVDLFVAPFLVSGSPSNYRSSTSTTSTETVSFTATTVPSVNVDDIYLVVVQDYVDGAPSHYTLQVDSTLPLARSGIPGSFSDSLESPDDLDLFIVNGIANRVLRVAVSSGTPDLDLVAAVFDPDTPDLLGADDDSGPGLDPLIQGVRFPASKPYGLAIFSRLADVTPGAGTGSYTVQLAYCTNTGTNTDGDGLVDACDDDDDDDGFIDDLDSAPTDASRCVDLDADGCDDCSAGPFDPFVDGPDFDGDGVCDAGDVDRDNDGCIDPADPAPLAPSADPDLDFLGNDCDNCPNYANPDQSDADADRRGDACECGDQDGDGLNTVADLVAINRAIFNPALVTPLCDANYDGACDVTDIVAANAEIF